MNYLNQTETEALETLIVMRNFFSAGERNEKVGRESYAATMHLLRKLIIRLQNKQLGCPTGSHSGACTCILNQKGTSTNAIYKKRNLQ